MRRASLVNGSLFKQLLKRYWPLWLGVLCAWLVLYVMPAASTLNEMTSDVYDLESSLQLQIWNALLPQSAGIACIVSVIVAMYLNERLFSGRAATFYGSTPATRRSIFATVFLVGFLAQVAVEVVVALCLLVVAVGLPAISGLSVLQWFAFAVASTFVMCAIAQLVCEVTGSRAVAVLLYLLVNVLVCFVAYAVGLIAETMLYGVYGFVDFEAAEWFSPLVGLLSLTGVEAPDGSIIGITWLPAIVYCIVAVAFIALAQWLDGRRDLETAGEAVSFPALAPVLKYLAAVCVAVLLGVLTVMFFLADYASTPDMAGTAALAAMMVVGAFLGLLFSQMSISKSPHVFGSVWKGGIVLACASVLFVGAFAVDVLGIETTVPQTDEVQDVELSVSGLSAGDLTSQEGVDAVRGLHQQIISTRDDREAYAQSMGDGSGSVDVEFYADDALYDEDASETLDAAQTDVDVTYHLKNGATVARSYPLTYYYRYWDVEYAEDDDEEYDDEPIMDDATASVLALTSEIANSHEAKLSLLAPVLESEDGYEVDFFVNYYSDDEDESTTYVLSGKQAREFVRDVILPDIDGITNTNILPQMTGGSSSTELDGQVEVSEEYGLPLFSYNLDTQETPVSLAWMREHQPQARLSYTATGKEYEG